MWTASPLGQPSSALMNDGEEAGKKKAGKASSKLKASLGELVSI
jgi:hypothetical protein